MLTQNMKDQTKNKKERQKEKDKKSYCGKRDHE